MTYMDWTYKLFGIDLSYVWDPELWVRFREAVVADTPALFWNKLWDRWAGRRAGQEEGGGAAALSRAGPLPGAGCHRTAGALIEMPAPAMTGRPQYAGQLRAAAHPHHLASPC
jgi:hypothetical protein